MSKYILESVFADDYPIEEGKSELIAGAVLASLTGLFLWFYYTRPEKTYFVGATLKDSAIQKIREKVRKIKKTPSGLDQIMSLLGKYADDYWRVTYRIAQPIRFIREYTNLMSYLKAHLNLKQVDGFFTSKETKQIMKLLSNQDFRNLFCRVVETTETVKGKTWESSRTRSNVVCDQAFRYLEELVKYAVLHNEGIYLGAATDSLVG